MGGLKTRKNDASVAAFLARVGDEGKRADARELAELMERITGEPPRMWGPSIVGFGSYHYRYASGREGDWPLTGFSPRKQALTLYIMAGFKEYDGLLRKLGKHKTGQACLYVRRLADVDRGVLEEIVRRSVETKKLGQA